MNAPTTIDTGDAPSCQPYTNRELSWLSFNRRVLAESENDQYPLLERLRFLSISASNLDEFMMVRVAGLEGQASRGLETPGIDGLPPRAQLTAIREQVAALEKRQQESLTTLRPKLHEQGVTIAGVDDLDEKQRAWLRTYFETDIQPLITPQAIDPSHPFPFVQNAGMGAIFRLKRGKRQPDLLNLVLIPTAAPRFVRLPGGTGDRGATYVAIEHLVTSFADAMFPGFRIAGDGVFRVLRDGDIEVEEEAEDLVRTFRTAIQRRRRGRPILLEVDSKCDGQAEALLREQFDLDPAMILQTNGLLGLTDLAEICDEPRPLLKFPPFTPRYPERILEHDGDCFSAIRAKDIVIHHPFESFDVVVDFLRQAASDPAVVSIKQTLYRAGDQSPVIAALIEAALAGKAVTAVVELKARFDEERNIHWANELERAGVQVVYGITDLKTHAKVSLVVRREDDGYTTYCHFGTGNYHPVNAKIYTDLSYFTANPALGRDAAKLFNFVTGYIEPQELEAIAISPLGILDELTKRIDAEIANARAGKPSGIWAKMNAITHKGLIDKLYEASSAGVEIRLVVRGICSLKAGIAGMSDNIQVKSVIGRFLEHSRIWAFADGKPLPSRMAKVYITSADAMDRNLERRVEVMVPITNKTVHDQVLGQVLLANILDVEQSWDLEPSGQYERMRPTDGERGFNCHAYFMSNPSLSGRGAALDQEDVPRLALKAAAG